MATDCYPRGLTVLVSHGEQLRITPEIRAVCAANPGVVTENHYGPTESHVATVLELPNTPTDYPQLPSIGTAVAGGRVRLLDAALRPVVAGQVGEMYLGGSGIAQGYEAAPGLTAARFVAAPGGRVDYRTGDLGAELPNGDIRLLGRSDTQVKVRGFRVECADIELALRALAEKFAGIGPVAVVARRLGGGDSVLEAFLVGEKGGTAAPVDAAELRVELRKRLPAHMIPARFHWIDALPRTPSGKRDDKALVALATDAVTHAESRSARPPADDYERALVQILAEFAGVGEMAANADFFEMGGTSVGAMRVAMTMARRFGVEIGLEAFVAAPTAADLAAALRAGGLHRQFDPIVPLRKSGERTPLFLVHPIGGNVMCYRDLTAHLPKGRPVYGLQAAGVDPGSEPLTTMEELAASYLAAIRRIAPAGPYHIAGWSFGGYIAFEMVRQLGADEAVQVVLLDTMAIEAASGSRRTEKDLIAWFFMQLLWYAGGGTDLPELQFDAMPADGEQLFDAVLRQATSAGVLPADSPPHLVRRLYGVFRANFEAMWNYRLRTLDRDIVVLRARDEMPEHLGAAHRLGGSLFGDSTNGWSGYAGRELGLVDIPGNHLTMMSEPNIADLAARLAELLDRADPTRPV